MQIIFIATLLFSLCFTQSPNYPCNQCNEPVGGDCADNQCASPAVCGIYFTESINNFSENNTCYTPTSQLGQACAHVLGAPDNCASGSYCNSTYNITTMSYSGTCLGSLLPGDPCTSTSQCYSPLQCTNGKCVYAGNNCTVTAVCTAVCCGVSQYCNVTGGTCVNYPANGQACNPNTGPQCGPISYCDPTSLTCIGAFVSGVGQVCQSTLFCQAGLYCNSSGFCATPTNPVTTFVYNGTNCSPYTDNNCFCNTAAGLYQFNSTDVTQFITNTACITAYIGYYNCIAKNNCFSAACSIANCQSYFPTLKGCQYINQDYLFTCYGSVVPGGGTNGDGPGTGSGGGSGGTKTGTGISILVNILFMFLVVIFI